MNRHTRSLTSPSTTKGWWDHRAVCLISYKIKFNKKKIKKANNTRYSQAVSHLSTNRAQPCLTSVIGRELVYSGWYGRWRCTYLLSCILNKMTQIFSEWKRRPFDLQMLKKWDRLCTIYYDLFRLLKRWHFCLLWPYSYRIISVVVWPVAPGKPERDTSPCWWYKLTFLEREKARIGCLYSLCGALKTVPCWLLSTMEGKFEILKGVLFFKHD